MYHTRTLGFKIKLLSHRTKFACLKLFDSESELSIAALAFADLTSVKRPSEILTVAAAEP